MKRKEFVIPEVKPGDFILLLKEDTKIKFLIHYAAPFTLDGEVVIPAGSRFSVVNIMGVDTFYIRLVNYDKSIDELYSHMKNIAIDSYPQISRRPSSYSFFITESQIKSESFSFIKGNKDYLLDIIAKQKEEAEFYKNYNPFEDEDWVEENFGDDYNELCECGKPKIITGKTDICPCCGHELRAVYWGAMTEEIENLKKERKIFIGEDLYGKNVDVDYKSQYGDYGFVQEHTKPDYACGNCGESFIFVNMSSESIGSPE